MPKIIAKEDMIFDTADSTANISFKQNGTEYLTLSKDGIKVIGLALNKMPIEVDSDCNTVAGNLMLSDTSNGAFTITFPDSSNNGDEIDVCDVKGTFKDNPVTIDGNGSKILGDDTFIVDINNSYTMFVYTPNGWIVK